MGKLGQEDLAAIIKQEAELRDQLKTLESMRATNALDGPTFQTVVAMIGQSKTMLGDILSVRRAFEADREVLRSATRSSFVIGIYGPIDVSSPIHIAVIEVLEPPADDARFFVHMVKDITAGRDLHEHVMPTVNDSLRTIASMRGLKKVPLRMVFAGPRYTPRSLQVDLHPYFDGYQYIDIRGGSGIEPQTEAVISKKGGRPAILKSVSEIYLIHAAQRGVELGAPRFNFSLPKGEAKDDPEQSDPDQLTVLTEQLTNFSKRSFRDQQQTAPDDLEKDFSRAIAFMIAWHGCEPWI